jgi:peptide/nickel transport system permease protein
MSEDKQKTWGTSYGEMVWREFAKSKFILSWLGFIILLFLLAIFAPFLANDKPFVIKIDGQLHWPMFKALTASDYSIFLAATVAVIQLLLVLRNRRSVDPSIRSGVLWRQIFVSVFVVLVGIILLYIFIPRRLDATDYKSMVASGKATNAVFALVPYGYGRTDLKVR